MGLGRGARVMVWIAAGLVVIAVAVYGARTSREGAQCGDGFEAHGTRCEPKGCPAPLAVGPLGDCRVPLTRIRVPPAHLVLGPSDWEAEGRVAPRTIDAGDFYIDAFEATMWDDPREFARSDPLIPKYMVTREEAAAQCKERGGRLPTEDEWIAAAAAPRAAVPRYPWGDTGAVCRRGVWGLARGPCGFGADRPDTVGAHASGDTPLGIHDMAGNVAEWVDSPAGSTVDIALGGSWRSELATDLRVWQRMELERGAKSEAVGFRCVYDAPR
jgi:formylglycine-generating enzyme required for sulfatase activity